MRGGWRVIDELSLLKLQAARLLLGEFVWKRLWNWVFAIWVDTSKQIQSPWHEFPLCCSGKATLAVGKSPLSCAAAIAEKSVIDDMECSYLNWRKYALHPDYHIRLLPERINLLFLKLPLFRPQLLMKWWLEFGRPHKIDSNIHWIMQAN
jgi:hypothetical protein